MLDRNTEYFDPFIIAERGRSYKGAIPLSQLERLSDALIDNRGDVQYDLAFAKEDKICSVTGQVKADLFLECSVCLGEMIWGVSSDTKLGIAASLEEAARLPEAYEPLLVVERQLRIKEIVEDELLLAIPIIPRHEACRFETAVDGHPMTERHNPFSILADLKSPGEQ